MKRKRKIIFYVVLSVLVIAGAAAIYIYKEYNRAHKDTAKLKADYTVNAADFVKEFTGNEQASNKKYWDKIIHVDGLVKSVDKDDRGFYSIIIGDTASMSSVRCSMDSIHNREAATVKPGSMIGMKGICSGYNADELIGSDVILVRCVIDEKK
jgi:tRNA_anti-like